MGNEETDVESLDETPDAEPSVVPAGPDLPGPVPRRAPGQKEVIPFAWKVCGYASDGCTLTFFKSVERADCEAQLERLQREGYYTGLAIYKIDETPPPAVMPKKAPAPKAAKRAAAETPAKKASAKSARAESDRKPAAASKKKAPKAAAPKTGKATLSKKSAEKSPAPKKKAAAAKAKAPKKKAK
jgi:hypothetical protein